MNASRCIGSVSGKAGIDAQKPGTMPRAEDDDSTGAHSPAFHDRPGSGRNIADKERFF